MSDLAFPAPLVATAWLAARLGRPDLVVLDASWHLPASGRDARAEYRAGHVPGARFWDLDALSDPRTPLPHMLPAPEVLAPAVGALGIQPGSAVVVYDATGVNLSAPRAWWMLRALGHDRVAVLDGGLGRWRAEGRPLEAGEVGVTPAAYRPRPRPELFRTLDEVRRALAAGDAQVVDARGPGRFEGAEPEPRPGLRGGHIPGSRNLHYAALVDPEGRLRPPAELRELFRRAGVRLDRPVITTCGSGVSACALALGLEVAGHADHAVYDGSWAEWGGRADTPVATGPSD